MEAEYIALSLAMRELIVIRGLRSDVYNIVFQSPRKTPDTQTLVTCFKPLSLSRVFEDNGACLKFASMPKMSPRTKHIAIPYHFFREQVTQLKIKVVDIDTDHQLADQFTKGLAMDKFEKARQELMGW